MTSVTVCRPPVWSTNRGMASRRERLRNPVYVRDRDRRPTWRTRRPSLVAQHPSAARICRTASRRPPRSRPGSETWPHGTSDTWHTARRRVQHRATLRSYAVAKSCEPWLGRTSGIDDLESDRPAPGSRVPSRTKCGLVHAARLVASGAGSSCLLLTLFCFAAGCLGRIQPDCLSDRAPGTSA